MANLVVHWELGSRHAEKLGNFYTSLFGWRVEKQSSMDYRVVYTGNKLGIDGGIAQIDGATPPYLTFYVMVNNLRATLATAESQGAKVALPPTPNPNVGTFAQINDPEGFLIGIIEPPPDWGDQVTDREQGEDSGNPVLHWEINSANAANLQGFYTTLFDWRIDTEAPDNYPMVLTGGEGGIGGGICQIEDDGPASLTLYVEVDDVQATLDKAQGLGANGVGELMHVPGIGTFSHISDPDGHVLGVMRGESAEG